MRDFISPVRSSYSVILQLQVEENCGWKVGISTIHDMTVCRRTRSGNTQIGVYPPFIVVLNYASQPLARLRSDHSDRPPMGLQLRTQ